MVNDIKSYILKKKSFVKSDTLKFFLGKEIDISFIEDIVTGMMFSPTIHRAYIVRFTYLHVLGTVLHYYSNYNETDTKCLYTLVAGFAYLSILIVPRK